MSATTDAALTPAAPSAGLAGLHAWSISHRTAPLAELESLSLAPSRVNGLLGMFRDQGIEAVLLSTCNRTELYTYAAGSGEHAQAARLMLAAAGRDAPPLDRFADLSGLDAATHLFRVSGGLESLVMGESEVLGQVRAAIEAAEASGTAGFFLSGLFRAALRFGGRARSETGIGTGALSVASAAVQLLSRVHRDLSSCTVLVVGTGVTGLKAARHLRAERVGRLVLANRTARRAEEAAVELGAEAIALADVPRLLPGFDAIITAARVEQPLIHASEVAASGREPGDPLVLIDVSMPRAIDPACATLPGVTLHDLSGLETIVTHNRAQREREAPRVMALLEHELRIFASQAQASTVRPLVAELRQRAEAIRRGEIERAGEEGLTGEALVDRVTRRIVDRLLQSPCGALRRGDLALDEQHARYLRILFGLETGAAEGPHGAGMAHGAGAPGAKRTHGAEVADGAGD